MAPNSDGCDLGPAERFARAPLTAAKIGTTRVVITHVNGEEELGDDFVIAETVANP